MAFRKSSTRALMAAVAVTALMPLSFAGQAAAQAPAAEIAAMTEAEANQFVAANKKITELSNTLTLELQAATDETAAASIAAKGEKEIIAIIEKEGMTAQRYTEIIQLAETDEATLNKLREKFGS